MKTYKEILKNLKNIDYTTFEIEEQIFNLNSEFHKKNNDFVIVFESTHSLLKKYNKSIEKLFFADIQFQRIKDYLDHLIHLKGEIILFNFYEINDYVFGNFSSKKEDSFIFQLRKLNFLLSDLIKSIDKATFLDISSIQNNLGSNQMFDASLYTNYEMVFNINGNFEVSKKIIDILLSQKSLFKKCLILDLDNTIWGGIIGDDGIEKIEVGDLGIGKSFKELQHWIRNLKDRGIILCVCSKNNEEVAKNVFLNHPEMVLKIDDISVFMANWDSKVNNIKKIREVLNIGFDSMVFLDDNIFERNIVRDNIPEICVPDLPEDPTNYLKFLYDQNLFETHTYSISDIDRTHFYQLENERLKFRKLTTDLSDYMEKIQMHSKVSILNSFNIPRVSELSQRSNQFNLRTIRYSETNLLDIMNSSNHYGFVFDLEDKFGAHGIVSFVTLKHISKDEIFIENWAMSCRVIERSLEQFIVNTISIFFKEKKYKIISAEYIKTKKNIIVEELYSKLGFKETRENHYSLLLEEYKFCQTYINLN
jgi:FkbH-like protein